MERSSGKGLQGGGSILDIRVPTTAHLFEALENILWFWPGVFVQLVKEDQGPALFDLTRSVRLTGQCEGLVVLRTSKSLGKTLATSLVADGSSSPDDAFNEFSNMFCGHIMNKLRASNQATFRHFLPMETSGSTIPDRPPEARMTVAIQSIVLDVRLWIHRVPLPTEKAG